MTYSQEGMAKNDGYPKAGDLVCHLVVNFMTIEADGRPKNGDLVCHLVVGLRLMDAPRLGTSAATRVWTF